LTVDFIMNLNNHKNASHSSPVGLFVCSGYVASGYNFLNIGLAGLAVTLILRHNSA